MDNKKIPDLSGFFSGIQNADSSAKQKAAQNMMASLKPEESKELNALMQDQNKINELLNSAAAQQILKKLNGKKNG